MAIKLAQSAIVTLAVISRVAIILAMGMILIVIGAGIYGSLGVAH